MDVSIAICTRDRAASLARTLASLSRMTIPDGLKWEVVVVNNASRDDTDAVIDHFRDLLPVRREHEAAPGLSNARNRAIATAKGAYVVWTDDDVMVDRHWISAYVEAFRKWPDAALFGGKIIPLFEEPMPDWLRECWTHVDSAYAFRDFGDDPLPITPLREPFGANFAVRMQEQKIYPYDPTLGLGARIATGEESDVIGRMREDGLSGYWVPAATVQHCIPRSRQTLQYLSAYYRTHGWRYAWLRAARDRKPCRSSGAGARLLGASLKPLLKLIVRYVQYRLCRWTAPSQVWIQRFAIYALAQGEFDFHRHRNFVSADPSPSAEPSSRARPAASLSPPAPRAGT